MNQILKQAKQIIRAFMREHYTDERLAMLLAHAQSEKLTFYSCCCFIGIPTADHALRDLSSSRNQVFGGHYDKAKVLHLANRAEHAFAALRNTTPTGRDSRGDVDRDARGRRRLIPIIKVEMRRREHARAQEIVKEQFV